MPEEMKPQGPGLGPGGAPIVPNEIPLIITYFPKTNQLNLQGPMIGNKLMTLGMLELAKEIVLNLGKTTSPIIQSGPIPGLDKFPGRTR